MRQVPGPDRDDGVARMRERARLDAEELVPRPPFGVIGLTKPRLRPGVLAEARVVNDTWESIALAYGDWAEPGGPWVRPAGRSRSSSSGLLPDLAADPSLGRYQSPDRSGRYFHTALCSRM
ncbi:MAG: hypothetical protein ACLQFR_20160 [Streptosporangiaceae bacterium]